MKKYFITATGTDIGKTYLTTALNNQLRTVYEKNTYTIKPVISGFDKDNRDNDTSLIIDSLGIKYNDENINKISPFRFSLPLSPDMASEKQKVELSYQSILEFCKKTIMKHDNKNTNTDDCMFVEGVGGVMSPICVGKTNLDLIADLDISVILVCGSYLGSITHSLTAIKTLEERKINISSIVICESCESEVDPDDLIKSMKAFTDHKIVFIKRSDSGNNLKNINIIEEIL